MIWINSVLALLAVVLGTSCIAAIWSVLILLSGGYSGIIAQFAALAVVVLLSLNGMRSGSLRALCAIALQAFATLYQSYIVAVGMIAGEMGFQVTDALSKIGFDFAFAVARAQAVRSDLLLYFVALVVAGVFGFGWQGKRSPLPGGRPAKKKLAERT